MVARIKPTNPVTHFLKEWRTAKRLTQQQLAERVGTKTSKDQISRWESGQRGMTMDVQAALAQALGIEPPDLFRNPETRSSLDKMLDDMLPPELADELHDEFERRIIRTKRLLDT